MRIAGMMLMHGTNNDKSIGTAASHACIRMHNEDALELAHALVEKTGGRKKGKVFALERKVPVRIVYKTIEAELSEASNSVQLTFYRDIYGKKTTTLEKMREALLEAGVPPQLIGTDEELSAIFESGSALLKNGKSALIRLPYKLPSAVDI